MRTVVGVCRPVQLHRALVAYGQASRGCPTPQPSLVPLLLLIVIAVWATFAADFTSEAWPLAVVAALPVLGFTVSRLMVRLRRRPHRSKRCARVITEHRPLLLARVIVLPPTHRRCRIMGKSPYAARLDATAGKPSRGVVARDVRLIARIHSA